MDVTEYLWVLRRRWVSALIGLLVALGASVAWGASRPMTYASSQTLFLIQSPQDSSAPEIRLNTYAALISNPGVVDGVRRDLGRTEPTEDLAQHLSASVQANTFILTVTATDTTPAGARDLVASASRELATVASTMNAASTAPASRLAATDSAAPGLATRTPARVLGLGLVLGLLVGIVAALLREATDGRVRGVDQLSRLGVPPEDVVEIHPMARTGTDTDVPPGARVLRAALLRDVPCGVTTVVVCSCDDRHAGQDAVLPLGITLARSGLNVVLVSADLRPSRQGSADLAPGGPGPDGTAPGGPGLGDVLLDGAPVQSLVIPGPVPGLWMLPRGQGVARSEDVLASQAMAAAVTQLRTTHSLLLFRAPPLDARTDALAVAESAGEAVVVLTAVRGRTSRSRVRAALATLAVAGQPVAAVVLVPPARRHGHVPQLRAWMPRRPPGARRAGPVAAFAGRTSVGTPPASGRRASEAAPAPGPAGDHPAARGTSDG